MSNTKNMQDTEHDSNYLLKYRTAQECAERIGTSVPEIKRLWKINALPCFTVGKGRVNKHLRSTFQYCDEYLQGKNFCRGRRAAQ